MTNAAARGGNLAEALDAAERSGRRVRVGLIGAGQMGTDILVQVANMPGLEIVAACDIDPARVEAGVAMAGAASRKVETADALSDVNRIAAAGRMAATRLPVPYRKISLTHSRPRSSTAIISGPGRPAPCAMANGSGLFCSPKSWAAGPA